MKQSIIYVLLLGVSLLSSCAKNANKSVETPHIENEKNHSHGDDVIVFSEEKAAQYGVVANNIVKGDFYNVIKVGGKLLAQQSHETTIVANSSGIVQLPDNLVEGLNVKPQQSLLAISSKNIQEGDPALRAKIAYEIAESEYNRVSPLAKEGIVTQKDFAVVKQTYENAKIAYNAIGKKYSAKGMIISSNQIGYVKEILVGNGSYVNSGDPILILSDNNNLFLRAEVPNRYYSELKDIASANFKIQSSGNIYELSKLNGKVINYAKALTSTDYLLPITFSLANTGGELLPGIYVEVYLLSKKLPHIIALPHAAIIEEEGLYFVYKKICKEEYKKVEVTLGMDNGKEYEILSGISEGDLIVTSGAQQLRLASATNAIPAHTHEH